MNPKASVAVLFCLFLAYPALGQNRLLRHPSYHQGRIVFDYLGDIWTARQQLSKK